MNKIKELEEQIYMQVSQCRLENDTLESYKAAIREQVVLDALPDDGLRANVATAYPTEAEEKAFLDGMEWFTNIITKTLTTREEVERQFREVLEEVKDDVFRIGEVSLETGKRINDILNKKR